MATVAVPVDILKQIATHIKSGADRLTARKTASQQVSAKAVAVADILVLRGLLNAGTRKQAAQALCDPLKALVSLEKLAQRFVVEPPKMGASVTDNTPSGEVKKGQMRDSDMAYLRGLGFTV